DARLLQPARRSDALGNVARDFREADQPTAVILERVDHHVGQEATAVLTHAPSLGLIPAIAGGAFERLLRRVRSAVLLGVEPREVLSDDLLGAVALDALCAPVPVGDDAIGIDHVDGIVGDAVDQHAIALLALAQRLGGCFTPGDIDDRRQNHYSLVGLDRVQANFDRELTAVLSETIEIAPGPHRPRPRIGKK